jgi:hypothetical protein
MADKETKVFRDMCDMAVPDDGGPPNQRRDKPNRIWKCMGTDEKEKLLKEWASNIEKKKRAREADEALKRRIREAEERAEAMRIKQQHRRQRKMTKNMRRKYRNAADLARKILREYVDAKRVRVRTGLTGSSSVYATYLRSLSGEILIGGGISWIFLPIDESGCLTIQFQGMRPTCTIWYVLRDKYLGPVLIYTDGGTAKHFDTWKANTTVYSFDMLEEYKTARKLMQPEAIRNYRSRNQSGYMVLPDPVAIEGDVIGVLVKVICDADGACVSFAP